MVLLLLTFCLLLLPLWESVIVLCFVVRYFMSILGITVQLNTAVLGAIGFMRIRNKSGGTLVNPDFHSPTTWS